MKKFDSLGDDLLTDDPVLIEAQGAILTAENMQEASILEKTNTALRKIVEGFIDLTVIEDDT